MASGIVKDHFLGHFKSTGIVANISIKTQEGLFKTYIISRVSVESFEESQARPGSLSRESHKISVEIEFKISVDIQ